MTFTLKKIRVFKASQRLDRVQSSADEHNRPFSVTILSKRGLVNSHSDGN